MCHNTFNMVYDVVRQIPYGYVTTYGHIAMRIGNPRLSRAVGYALHANPNNIEIPCHRVVNRFGEVSKAFAFGGENEQVALLVSEGVGFIDGKVNLSKHLWLG